jgi:hypothetical protein
MGGFATPILTLAGPHFRPGAYFSRAPEHFRRIVILFPGY